jgi:release factor glutamine methyltransferase
VTPNDPAASTWRDLRSRVERSLAEAGISSPSAEARWILAEAWDQDGAIEGADDVIATGRALASVEEMLERRLGGEPLQYVLRGWSFRDLDLFVDPRVLIPRPETEITAQVAIDEAVKRGARSGPRDAWTGTEASFAVADLGTGSGAIALSLVTELADAEVWATDASAGALAVARANIAGTGSAAARVRVVQGDWFGALPEALRGNLRVVVSNPPYISESEIDDLAPEVAHHEPRGALVSGPTGLEAIERIVADSVTWLEADGALVLELAPHQADAARALARGAGFASVRIVPDLAGRDRVLVAEGPRAA